MGSKIKVNTVSTSFDESAESLLKELSVIPTLKTTCGNRGRYKNVARELSSAKSLASMKKRVGNKDRSVSVGAKRKTAVTASKDNTYCNCPVLMKLQNRNRCKDAALVHPGFISNVSSLRFEVDNSV
ncbi:hypothetical protein TNCV_1546841 [Trichonephila clavipes]|nr:hypothetical protein TNCV_1546841 [Trichonephila clavipes]